MTGKEVVNWRGVKALGIPYSRTHWFRLCASGEAPMFFKLRAHRNSPPVWWLHEIVEWLEARAKTNPADAPTK